MPDYVPIQDLTIVGSIDNNDLFPMSDGSGAYAVKGSTIKSYSASDAQAAAADAALSKTAAQNAATAAGNAQTAAEAAVSAITAETPNISKYFDQSSYSADNQFGVTDMPYASYTWTTAKKFSDCPSEIGQDTIIGITRERLNASGISLVRVVNYDNNYLYYAIYNTGSGLRPWVKVAKQTSVDTIDYTIKNYNVYDLMDTSSGIRTTGASNGITYTWDGRTCVLDGEATSLSFKNLINSQSALPQMVKPGDVLSVQTTGFDSSNIRLKYYLYPNTLQVPREVLMFGSGQIEIPDGCTGILIRIEIAAGTVLGNHPITVKILSAPVNTDRSIKLLVYGSSFSYSTLGYLGGILAEIAPKLHIIIGICYESGATLQTHITYWDNDTTYPAYSEYDSDLGRWVNFTNQFTGKGAFWRKNWDYVVFQQGVRYGANYDDLEAFADRILAYSDHNVSFLYNMAQALGANCTFPSSYTQPTGEEKSDAMFAVNADFTQRAMGDKLITDFFPCGTAVQNARTSSLKSIGTSPYLYLCDDNAGHLRNGIGPLIAGYTAAYKIMELVGLPPKMFTQQLNPTDDWLTAINLYTRTEHGSCQGVSAENKIIAQKCAMMAIKHPFEISDMSDY